MAAKRGMIGIAMSNGDPVMAIPGSMNVAIGNNPLALALSIGNGKSLFLDIALSSVAALKVVMARDRGDQVPAEWLINETGQHTSDPSGFPGNSHLTPMAGHKGYGLAILVETLSAVLTGAEMLSKVVSWNRNLEQRNGVGHTFLAVDISQMMPLAEFEDRAGRMVEELKAGPKAPGVEKILVPGEMEWGRREAALSSGKLELEDAIAENLEKLAALTGVKLCWEDQ